LVWIPFTVLPFVGRIAAGSDPTDSRIADYGGRVIREHPDRTLNGPAGGQGPMGQMLPGRISVCVVMIAKTMISTSTPTPIAISGQRLIVALGFSRRTASSAVRSTR
jgi:hypothetical protein